MVTTHDMWDRIDRNVKQLVVPVAVLLSTLQLSRYQVRKRMFRVGRAFRLFVSRSFRSCSIAYLLRFVKRFSEQFWLGSENSSFMSLGLSAQVQRPEKEPTYPREGLNECWEGPAR
jgi:hypothetical protein